MKIRKGDQVKIVVGKDKGKTGPVENVFVKEAKVLITGINQFKRHIKAKTQNQKSEIVTITKPLPISSVALICPKCHEQTRVGFSIKEGKKERICKKCDKQL